MQIRATADGHDRDWLALRRAFIPELNSREHAAILRQFMAESAGFQAFVAHADDGQAMGFAEVSVRTDYVNGCEFRPALYLEGIYVDPGQRGRGVARALCEAAEGWGLEQGCREFASDVHQNDAGSLAAHAALGFEETERVVFFRRPIRQRQGA
ncbi:aminoglycoside 6'-N-acetyltransferase [Elongatibacter sediminis]|uniref:Aminoglycoside N(6')-acetyltransferase type 1 n=1 Tax=Elongatibacter sediminis TaxID=3119006 RepID=A0AAW9RBY3_9GAMM